MFRIIASGVAQTAFLFNRHLLRTIYREAAKHTCDRIHITALMYAFCFCFSECSPGPFSGEVAGEIAKSVEKIEAVREQFVAADRTMASLHLHFASECLLIRCAVMRSAIAI